MYAKILMRKRVDRISTGDVLAVLTANNFWNDRRRHRKTGSPTDRGGLQVGRRERLPDGTTRQATSIGYALPQNGVKVEHHKALHHGDVGNALLTVRSSRAWEGDEAGV